MPQILEETIEVVVAPTERVQQRTVEHVPEPQLRKETVEVVKWVPQERVQRIGEQIAEVPILQIVEDSVEEFKIVP